MTVAVMLWASLMSIFSTAVLSYISMATPIGPWIAPTIVLIVSLLFKILIPTRNMTGPVTVITISSSVGGILATACGFSFPTLYFLNKPFFEGLIAQPWYFIGFMSLLAGAAGLLAFMLIEYIQEDLLKNSTLAFPVSNLIYNTIQLQNSLKKAGQLAWGFGLSIVWSVLQRGVLRIFTIPRLIKVFPAVSYRMFSISALSLQSDTLPMFLAIGFIAGTMIAFPLLWGAAARIMVIDPLNVLFFADVSSQDFLLAFCSGMIVMGTGLSFLDLPKIIKGLVKNIKNKKSNTVSFTLSSFQKVVLAAAVLLNVVLWYYCSFTVLAYSYLVGCSLICAYQIVIIATQIGLAQLGRFATFVMVPALFLFKLSALQITVIAAFVELCGGIATDFIFGRKVAQLANISMKTTRLYQLLGLAVSSLSIGVIFWYLIHHFGLGTSELFAQRAQARALLINMSSFNVVVLALGACFGCILKYFKMNSMLMLGGILMPLNYSCGLILGGLLTLLVKNPSRYEPFWSGIFTANSLIELLKAFCR